jgi:hypothetical protein
VSFSSLAVSIVSSCSVSFSISGLLSLFCLFLEETAGGLLFFCALAFHLIALLSKETFMGVPVRISECCLALHCLQGVCGPITGNGDAALIGAGREDTVAGQ